MISLLLFLVKWIVKIVMFIILLPFRVIKMFFSWIKTGDVHKE